jgi:ribosomal protein S18 acetylase RimI-like enzyme
VSEVALQLARLGDAPAIANMSRTLVEAGLPWSWTPRRVADLMRRRESLAVIAKVHGDLVGFVLAQFGDRAVHVALLAVAEGRRREGIARRLLGWVEESAVVAGLFQVNLEVRAINRSARCFYTALGYVECGRMNGYYSGVEDAIRMSRDLLVRRPGASLPR